MFQGTNQHSPGELLKHEPLNHSNLRRRISCFLTKKWLHCAFVCMNQIEWQMDMWIFNNYFASTNMQ